MTFEVSYNKKQELFDQHLKVINDINFTCREIDVIACILHQRGEKKIASLLLISPRTVGAHIHNIMLKLGYSSREYIIDLIEKSGKVLFIRQYYFLLLIENLFKTNLVKIGKIVNRQGINCHVNYKQSYLEKKSILNQIKGHLELANISLNFPATANQEVTPNFCLLSPDNYQDNHRPIILIIDKQNISIESQDYEYLDFSKEDEYYLVMFSLLQKIIPKNSLLEEIIEHFIKEYKAIIISFEDKTQIDNSIKFSLDSILIKKNLILLICIFIPISGFLAKKVFVQESVLKIIIDKPLINEKILLKRKLILDNIEEILRHQDNIKHVVLVGIGGIGKTTLARQYMRNQTAKLKWEINCETHNDIMLSCQNLAYTLCNTESERSELTIILQNTRIVEKEKNLFLFLSKKLKHYNNWILLYDNVEEFKDIQQYFPYDPNIWSNGTIIITTRDNNISNNTCISNENILQIGELELKEKLDLFNKILYHDNYNINDQEVTLIDFLQKIPPFPLDISIAATYLKETRISFSEYLEYINQSQEEFVNFQKQISSTLNEYNKTRHEIITLSLKYIIETDPNFADLLLFISLINVENISKELLVNYKNDIIVSKFIHELKRFSLIHETLGSSKLSSLKLSIHHSIQLNILSYLNKVLKLNSNSLQFQDISNSLLYTLSTKPLFSISPHVEMFLTHYQLFNENIRINLSQELGIYYSHTSNYQRARELLEKAFEVNKQSYGIENIKTAGILMHLAVLYRNIGWYYEAIELIESKVLKTYKKHYGQDHIETAKCITYLGNLYRDTGDYKKAQELLEYSLAIHIKEYAVEKVDTARTKGYLGTVYNDIGEYTKAKTLLEQAFNSYSNHSGKSNAVKARSFVRLGNLYRNLEEYEKATKLVRKALIIFEENYGKNHLDTAFALNSLGDILLSSGNYKEGQKFLERALIILEENYGKNHLDTAFALNSLGKANLLSNNILLAETLINQALSILQQNKHTGSFIPLENLGDLYIQKSRQVSNKKNRITIQDCHKQALLYFEQALEIVQTYLPANSPHATRIKLKLRTHKLQE